MDDGSTDLTGEIASSFGGVVNCLRQENRGQAQARNTGIRQCKHEWIAFLDADDEWLPFHIENAHQILSHHAEIQWYCDAFERRDDDGNLIYLSKVGKDHVKAGVIPNYFIAEAEWSFSRPSSMLINKRVFEFTGLFDQEIGQYGEDLDMWFKIGLYQPMIAYSSTPGSIYRYREGSITYQDNIDILRFVRRIERTRSNYSTLDLPKTRESEYLIKKWLISAIKLAVKQRDRRSLAEIFERFDDLLPWSWRQAAWFLKSDPGMDLTLTLHHLRSVLRGIKHS